MTAKTWLKLSLAIITLRAVLADSGALDGCEGGGGAVSPVHFKKWQCPLLLF